MIQTTGQISIVDVNDGTSPISVIMSNESCNLPANISGTVLSFDNTGPTIKVYEGDRLLINPSSGQLSTGTWQVVSSTSDADLGITVAVRAANGESVTYPDIAYWNTGNAVLTAKVVYTIQGITYTGKSFTVIKEQVITKAMQGSTGAGATYYSIATDVAAIKKSASGTISPTTLNIQAYRYTTSKSAYSGRFKVYENGSATANYTSSSNEATKAYNTSGVTSKLKIELYAAGGTTTLLDTQELLVLEDGSNSIIITVANGNYAIPTAYDGTVATYVGSGTTITVKEGINPLTYRTTLDTNTSSFSIGTPTVSASGTTINVGARGGDGTTTATVADHNTMGSGDVVIITYPITYNRANGSQGTENVVQTITKSKQGVRGSRTLYASDTAYTSTYDYDGSATTYTAGLASYKKKATDVVYNATNGSSPRNPINGDTVTFSNNSDYVFTLTYDASLSDWKTPGTVIDGSLLVTGSVTAAKINSNGLSINAADGTPILQAGSAITWSKLGSASSNLTGLGYIGDLDATNGAPAGTYVGDALAEDIVSSISDFDASNNQLSAPIPAVAIKADYSAVDHTVRTDGAVDISLEWVWPANSTTFRGALDNGLLTVSTISNGALAVGSCITGTGIPAGVYITDMGTGVGSIGTYITNSTYTTTPSAVFNASFSGTVMTVTKLTSGIINQYSILNGVSTPGTYIVSQSSGTPGGAGTYNISNIVPIVSADNLSTSLNASMGANTNASFTARIDDTTLTVTGLSAGVLMPGQKITGTGVSNVYIVSQLDGTTGSIGTYQLSRSNTVTSRSMTASVSEASIDGFIVYAVDSALTERPFLSSSVVANSDYIPYIGHGFETNQTVEYKATTTPLGGLVSGKIYYIIKLSEDAVKLASSSSNALKGIGITFTSIPSTEEVQYLSGGVPATISSGAYAISVPSSKRVYYLRGAAANRAYTFAVRAYRRVNPSVNSSGIVYSTMTYAKYGIEYPYIPNRNVAFNGNITGTVNNYPASEIAAFSQFDGTNLLAEISAIVTASSGTPSKSILTDGNKGIGSAYTSISSGAQYITASFIDIKYIASSYMYWYASDGRLYNYAIAISIDNINWTWVVGNGDSSGVVSTYAITRANINGYKASGVRLPTIDSINAFAKYVRIYCNGNTVNTNNYFYEWEIWSGGAPADPYLEDYSANIESGATVGAIAGNNLKDSVGNTVSDLNFLNKYSVTEQLAGDLSGNPFLTKVDPLLDRPAGIKASYGSNTASTISYYDVDRTILNIYSATDTTTGAVWPAFRVQPNMRYRVFIRWKTIGATLGAGGIYFRFLTKTTEIAQGKTHIGYSVGEAVVDTGGGSGGNTAKVISDTNGVAANSAYENVSPTADDTWYETVLEYTPSSTIKWTSFCVLNYTGIGTAQFLVDTCFIYPVTTAEDGATVGAPTGTYVGGTLAETVASNAANALSGLQNKLNKAGDTITGRIDMSVADGLFAGTDLNNGVYLGNGGLVGKKAGATTFAIDTAGNATFGGVLNAASGTFAGALSAATGTFSGTLTADAIDAVNTVNIAGQAVTIPIAASSSSTTVSSALTSASITLTEDVPIHVSAVFDQFMSSSADYYLYRNGTQIAKSRTYCDTFLFVPVSLVVLDSPGVGTHTYSLGFVPLSGTNAGNGTKKTVLTILATKR